MEDKSNREETRLKYHLIALREIEKGLTVDIMTGKTATADINN